MPKPMAEKIILRASEKDRLKLRALAAVADVSMSEWVRQKIREEADRQLGRRRSGEGK